MPSNNSKVSIIVPIYNVEKYLHQCIDSIVNQTLKEIEIILVNDGSTDSSLSIIKDYAKKDNRIIIIDKPNTGYGHSMNLGIERATGEYIGIVESDDWVEKNMFEALYDAAKLNDVDIVKSDFYLYWAEPEEIKVIRNFIPKDLFNRVLVPQEERDIFMAQPSIWSAIYRSSFLRNNKIRFLETPGASYQDASFNFKVWAVAKKVYFLKEAFVYYRQDNANSSTKSKGKAFYVCREYLEIEHFLKANNLQGLLPLSQRVKYSGYMWNFQRLPLLLKWEFCKVMCKELKQAYDNNLIDRKYFTDTEYRKVKLIVKSPLIFFIKRMISKAAKKIIKSLWRKKEIKT